MAGSRLLAASSRIRALWTNVSTSPSTYSPSARSSRAVSNAPGRSLGACTGSGSSVTLARWAADGSAFPRSSRWAGLLGTVSTPSRDSFGVTALSSCRTLIRALLGRIGRQAGGIAAGPRQAADQPQPHGIGGDHEDDRHGLRRLDRRLGRHERRGQDDVHLGAHQLRRQSGELLGVAFRRSPLDVHVPPLDIAEPAQGAEERLERGPVGRVERIGEHSDAIDLRARLRFSPEGARRATAGARGAGATWAPIIRQEPGGDKVWPQPAASSDEECCKRAAGPWATGVFAVGRPRQPTAESRCRLL